MKFLAILKDSFREAADSKVLYVMVAFSLTVIFVVGSISYHPVAGAAAMPMMVEQFGWEDAMREQKREGSGFRHAAVIDFRQLGDAPLPYRGEYQFMLQGLWVGGDVKDTGKESAALEAERFVKTQFEQNDFEVIQIKHLAEKSTGSRYTFDVRVRGIGSGRAWPHEIAVFFGAWRLPFEANLGYIIYFIEDTLVDGVGGWFAILVSIIITAFFIPNMLHKGTIDLLLAKPIGRNSLLLFKYLGGLTFMFVNSAIAVGGIWLVLGLRSGLWPPEFLLSALVLTFYFALLYSVSTLIAVLTRSAVISILIACLTWFLFAAVGRAYVTVEIVRKLSPDVPEWLVSAINAIHAVTPRTKDLEYLITRLLTRSLLSEGEIRHRLLDKLPEFSWAESLGVSMAFIAVMLGLACWRFSKRDY